MESKGPQLFLAFRGTCGRRHRPTTPDQNAWEERTMAEEWKDEEGAQNFWYRGKVTRRRVVGWGGGAIGALMLVPSPWRAAFGAAKPYKIGSEQPLSGAGAG
jgi:hypothetical protein